MGQKVNPNGFRFGITKKHNTTWFGDKKNYVKYLVEDQKIYDFFNKLVRKYLIGQVEINRNQKNEVIVRIHSARPAAILGQGGENIKNLREELLKTIKNKNLKLSLDVVVLEKPELNARLLAEEIAIKLENRGSFRAAQKFAINQALKNGATGIKTSVSGRLNGVDMARKEGYTQGEMKLHTLRQNVDYALAEAHTISGIIGVKVWVSKGDIYTKGVKKHATTKTH